jgi:hypothetical protein
MRESEIPFTQKKLQSRRSRGFSESIRALREPMLWHIDLDKLRTIGTPLLSTARDSPFML